MARNTFGRLVSVRTLIRVVYAAISLNAIPYAKGAETVPVRDYGHPVMINAAASGVFAGQ